MAVLERFQEKCAAVFRPEPRPNKETEHFRDSKNRENALRPVRLILIALAGAAAFSAPAAAADSLEYAVKAAYLVKFVPFIDWPDTAFASPDQPVTICVLGADPFGGRLDALAGQKAGARVVAVKHVEMFDAAAGCQLLFLGAAPQAADALAGAQDKPVVTVTDSGEALRGIIAFVITDNHVRFDIDAAAAEADGIKISSKLLELAHAVKRKGAP
jgi:hypothetical protein